MKRRLLSLILVGGCSAALDLPPALAPVDAGPAPVLDVGHQPCSPNPCTEANRRVCTVTESGEAQCDCDEGYDLTGELCLANGGGDPGASGCGDDSDSCMAGANALSRGEALQGAFDDASDQADWYLITGPSEGGVERVTVTGLDESGDLPTIELFEFPGETALAASDQGEVAFEVTAGAHLLVAVRAVRQEPMDYELLAEFVGADDHGDTVDTGTEVSSGDHAFRLEMTGDVDVLLVTDFVADSDPEDPSALLVRAELDEGQDPLDLQIRVGSVERVGEFSYRGQARHTVDGPGAFAVKLRAPDGHLLSGTLRVQSLRGDDHGDEAYWSSDLQLRRSVSASLGEGDQDWFRLRAAGSQVYRVTLGGAPGRNVEVFSPLERLRWSLEEVGVYYVHGPLDSDAFLKVSGAAGAYSLTVEDRALQDEAGETTDEALPLNDGEAFPAAIQFLGDEDLFLFPAFPTGGCWRLSLATGSPQVRLSLVSGNGDRTVLDPENWPVFATALGERSYGLVQAAPGQQVEQPLEYEILGETAQDCP